MKYINLILLMLLSIIISAVNINDIYFKKSDLTINNNVSLTELISDIDNISFPKLKTGLIIYKKMCIDGVTRPFAVYVPEDYNRKDAHTLLVYLHGGVNRELMTIDELKEYDDDWEIKKLADDNNYIVLYPTGEMNALWWDSIGTDNILSQIYFVKNIYNINDNKVFMTGFSDGASAAFYFAMCYPTLFAGFLPLNGHAGVANIDGKVQTYFQNLSNRPLHVINTDEDGLYPDKIMREMMAVALKAGANLTYRIYTGIGHDFDYGYDELPILAAFINNTNRPDFPNHVRWYTDNENTRNRIDWLEINKIADKDIVSMEDMGDYNMTLSDERIMLGFYPDYEFQGPGIKVSGIAGDSTLCGILGIEAGDIFIQMDEFIINTFDDMDKYKQTKQRGDSTSVKVIRNGDTLFLKGAYPPIQYYPLFTRDNPTAFAEGYFIGNEYHINTINADKITIYINARYINLNQPIKVFINDKEVFNETLTPDLNFMLNQLTQTNDRRRLYIRKLEFEI